jgi:hypothetical protein
MKRIFFYIAIFFVSYGIAYGWGVYDLRTNPPKIENDGDLATLGMMPIFLHIYGVTWGILSAACYGVFHFINSLIARSKSKFISDEKTI